MKIEKILKTMEYGKAPESQKLAQAWIEKNKSKFGLFIDGKFQFSKGRDFFETRNPATGELLAFICQANQQDVDQAMHAARTAQNKWEKIGGADRAKYIYALARLIQKHARLFSVLETLSLIHI